MTELLVSRVCTAYPPQGPPFLARIGVFSPVVTEHQAWECKLSLDGILDDERNGFGVDQWDALQMGMQMIWVELSLKTKMGWRFAWSNGENMEIDELLPLWGKEVASKF